MVPGVKCDRLQVCIVVKDLDEAMKRYTDLLGVGPFLVYTVDTDEVPGVTRDGKPTSYAVRVGITKLGSGVLELFQSLRGETIWKEFFDRHGEGLHHLGFYVKDFDAALATFTGQGFKITVDGPIVGKERTGRFTYFDTQDRMGTTLELLDFPEDLMAQLE
jgi:catechol 2,3-dioxygenase-like lactoylglutathione lyase family enzyme